MLLRGRHFYYRQIAGDGRHYRDIAEGMLAMPIVHMQLASDFSQIYEAPYMRLFIISFADAHDIAFIIMLLEELYVTRSQCMSHATN